MITSFEELRAWQLAREHARAVHALSLSKPMCRDFGLIDQINRAAGSIMDNIAEGFDRGSRGEFLQFLGYAKGSTGEVRSQLYRAADRAYLSASALGELLAQNDEVSRVIRGLIVALTKTSIRGSRFPKAIAAVEQQQQPSVAAQE